MHVQGTGQGHFAGSIEAPPAKKQKADDPGMDPGMKKAPPPAHEPGKGEALDLQA